MPVINLAEHRKQRHEAIIERESDPAFPNRNFYIIQSKTREGVEGAIAHLTAEVESFGNGYGNFIGPHKAGGVFFAIGETVIHTDIG
jgi:hypothetical protein